MRADPTSATAVTRLDRVAFIHVPKTAGMAVHTVLERWAGPSASRRFGIGGLGDWERHRALTDSEVASLRFISGHIGYPAFAGDPRYEDWLLITVIREPVARILSLYSYVRGWEGHPWHAAVADQSLDVFIDYLEREGYTLDTQTRMVSGTSEAAQAFQVLQERYYLATTTEGIDGMMRLLGQRLGADLTLERVNESPSRVEPAHVEAATIERIRSLNPQDAELYRLLHTAGIVGTGARGSPRRPGERSTP